MFDFEEAMVACRRDCAVIFSSVMGERELGACPAYSRARSALESFFNFHTFRPGQLEVLLPALHGRDVFARMATGAGKSICFYLVPLALGISAVAIVISPLNALMDQQVRYV